jgi:Ca2+-binding RTX toxin-like protein
MRPLLALLASGMVAAGPTASAAVQQSTCAHDDPSKTVTLNAVESVPGQPSLLVLTAEGGVISLQELDFEAGQIGPRQPCGAGTTANTDLVRVQGGGAAGVLLLVDQTFGEFAPGFTVEPTGASEIEFEFHPMGAIVFFGTAAPTVVRLGTAGANVNGDDDVDVTLFSTPAGFGFVGGPGSDDIGATGGLGTGDPATLDFVANGGGGNDVLAAGRGRALLEGFGGNDVVIGGPADDSLTGGSGKDRVVGGGGADDLEGNAGNDRLLGGAGKDALNGGPGSDRCIGGPGKDRLRKCEN